MQAGEVGSSLFLVESVYYPMSTECIQRLKEPLNRCTNPETYFSLSLKSSRECIQKISAIIKKEQNSRKLSWYVPNYQETTHLFGQNNKGMFDSNHGIGVENHPILGKSVSRKFNSMVNAFKGV